MLPTHPEPFHTGNWNSLPDNPSMFYGDPRPELFRASSSLHLKVSMSKSNIAVFRKGCYLGARERWTYDSVILPVVNAYKYLGVLFSTKLSFTASCYDLTSKAKNAVLFIM